MNMAMFDGLHDESKLRRAIEIGCDMTEKQKRDEKRYALIRDLCEWYWEPLRHEGVFDFAANDYMKRGIRLFGECTKRGYTRSMSVNNCSHKTSLAIAGKKI